MAKYIRIECAVNIKIAKNRVGLKCYAFNVSNNVDSKVQTLENDTCRKSQSKK